MNGSVLVSRRFTVGKKRRVVKQTSLVVTPDTDFGAQLDWTRRYVGGRGQRFTLGGAVVQERRKLAADLRYQIPLQPLAESRIELVARHESKDLTFEDVELDEGGETRIVGDPKDHATTDLIAAVKALP